MTFPKSVAYDAAVEYLADGKWHDLEKTMKRVMEAVPPGKATQQAERSRVIQYRRRGNKDPLPRQYGYDMDRLIQIGARTIARSTLNNRGRFLINSDRTKIRLLTPDEIRERASKGNSLRSSKGWETRLKAKGIDPDKHVTKEEAVRIRREIMAAWTPEQWSQYHADNNRKAWETRRKRAKEARERLQDLSGHQGPGQRREGDGTPGVREGPAAERQGGTLPGDEA